MIEQVPLSLGVDRLLRVWLSLGLAWMVLGMLFLPSSKLYHQGLILFLWLPGLAALHPRIWRSLSWDRWLATIMLGFFAWSVLSIQWGGDVGHLKEMLYVALSLQSFVLMGYLQGERFPQQLACLALLAGLFVGWSIFEFYVLQGNALQTRLLGSGLLDQPILAGHVIGALGVLLWFSRQTLPGRLQGAFWLLGCALCFVFVLLTRSKGPILAVLAALVFSCVSAHERWVRVFAGLILAITVLAACVFPEFLMRGGLSYRPDLLRGAWELYLQHPWLGLGMGGEYQLTVLQTGKVYEHAHNLFAHVLLQFGMPGLLLWLSMLVAIFLRLWKGRDKSLGYGVSGLLCFAVVALLSDGVGPWVKPREEWFTVWLPVLLYFAQFSAVAADRGRQEA